jgi:hypothetical protein
MTAQDEMQPAVVPEGATQAGETSPKDWDWVERQVWTERMLEALVKGVKGGVWFSLIDKIQRPSTLAAAWLAVKRNGGSSGSDHQSIEGISRGHDHFRWPNGVFRVQGLFSLEEAHRTLLQSSSR